jgi:hypothetical protein
VSLEASFEQGLDWARRHWLWLALGSVLVLGVVVVWAKAAGTSASDTDAPAARADARGEATSAALPAGEAVEGQPVEQGLTQPASAASPGLGGVDAGGPLSPTVKVVFKTFPPRRATVMWGGKRLGVIERGQSLVVERPRDSGPMDVVIRSPGYLPVHARAYTFDNALVDVRITPVDKKDTIYGYREPLPPEDAGAPLP